MNRLRLLSVIAVLVAVGATVGWLSRGSGSPSTSVAELPRSGKPMTLARSSDCRPCHQEVYDEWAGSQHGLAYTNPEVQRLSKGFRDRDCLPCHAPRPIPETGLGERALERLVTLEEGVDCFACHKHHDTMLGGTHIAGAVDAPCNPVPSAAIKDLRTCTPCHDQHKVVQDWKETHYAVPGPGFKDCNGCHMPEVDRPATATLPARKGKSHRFPASHDLASLKSAASMKTSVDGRAVGIEVRNDGTGHNFPADERHRAVDLVIVAETSTGSVVSARIDRYRNPYRDEFDLKSPLRNPGAEAEWIADFGAAGRASVRATRVAAAFNPNRKQHYAENTQIPAGEARRYAVVLPESLRSVTVRLLYKRQPFLQDAEAILLHESVLRVGG
ncbi:MAG: hypothetical protein RIS21_1354 [Planctomycetota bacterium]|jgi:hypothetical protein